MPATTPATPATKLLVLRVLRRCLCSIRCGVRSSTPCRRRRRRRRGRRRFALLLARRGLGLAAALAPAAAPVSLDHAQLPTPSVSRRPCSWHACRQGVRAPPTCARSGAKGSGSAQRQRYTHGCTARLNRVSALVPWHLRAGLRRATVGCLTRRLAVAVHGHKRHGAGGRGGASAKGSPRGQGRGGEQAGGSGSGEEGGRRGAGARARTRAQGCV